MRRPAEEKSTAAESEGWFESEIQDMFAKDEDEALNAAIDSLLTRQDPLDASQSYMLLQAARAGNKEVLRRLPVRPTASPFIPNEGMVYIVSQRLASGVPPTSVSARPEVTSPPPRGGVGSRPLPEQQQQQQVVNSIPVSFQSILNSDLWWSPRRIGEGVAARPMSRVRAHRDTKTKRRNDDHGYRGRMYTMITLEGDPVEMDGYLRSAGKSKPPDSSTSNLRLVGGTDVQIVHAWPQATPSPEAPAPTTATLAVSPLLQEESPPTRARSRRRLEQQQQQQQQRPLPLPSIPFLPRQQQHQHPPHIHREVNVVDSDMYVQGNLHVSGLIYGRLASQSADFAEWFEWDDCILEQPPKGTVVQLREKKLFLDTSSFKGPCLIVSTSPAVAANVPGRDKRSRMGAYVAFVGQVPVRCRGPISSGDVLIPSGLNDGYAISASTAGNSFNDVLGSALESSSATGESYVMCFVQWQRQQQHPQSPTPSRQQSPSSTLLDVIAIVATFLAGIDFLSIHTDLVFSGKWAVVLLLLLARFRKRAAGFVTIVYEAFILRFKLQTRRALSFKDLLLSTMAVINIFTFVSRRAPLAK